MKDEDRELQKGLQRVEKLLGEVEAQSDARAVARTREIVQALMDFHGAGIERIFSLLSARASDGQAIIDTLAEDDLIASMLLLYGLHPLDLRTRVEQALDQCRPYLNSHGGNVELLGVDDGVVRLRLHGSCHGCPSSAATLKQTIEEAILEKAPDAISIEVEGETAAMDAVMAGGSAAGRLALPILAG